MWDIVLHFFLIYIIIINAVDEMHEINDWFGRSQNGIAESERRCICTTEEERLMKNFQSCFNGCHKWMEKKSIYYFIKLQQQMKTLTTCIRCAIFDLISSINTTIYLQYRTVGHSGMNSKYWECWLVTVSVCVWFIAIARKQYCYIKNYYEQFRKISLYFMRFLNERKVLTVLYFMDVINGWNFSIPSKYRHQKLIEKLKCTMYVVRAMVA